MVWCRTYLVPNKAFLKKKMTFFLLFSVIFRKNGRCTTVAKEHFEGVIGNQKRDPPKPLPMLEWRISPKKGTQNLNTYKPD